MVLGFAFESASPNFVVIEVGSRKNARYAVAERDRFSNGHRGKVEPRLCLLVPQNAAPNVQIALRKWNLDPEFAQLFLDGEIEVALESAWPMAQLRTPHDQLEID